MAYFWVVEFVTCSQNGSHSWFKCSILPSTMYGL